MINKKLTSHHITNMCLAIGRAENCVLRTLFNTGKLF